MEGLSGLTVWCEACGRHSEITKAEALRLWGARTRTRDVARDLRCKVCGAVRAIVKVQATTWCERRADDIANAEANPKKAEPSD